MAAIVCAALLWGCSLLYLLGTDSSQNSVGHTSISATPPGVLSKHPVHQPEVAVRSDKFLADVGNMHISSSVQARLPLVSASLASASEPQLPVLCGGHHAATCSDCIVGHDSSWCHGDCVMLDGICQPRSLAHQVVQEETGVLCGGHRAASCPECITGHDEGWCHGVCAMWQGICQPMSARDGATIPQIVQELIKEYPFQPVITERDEMVNIVLVRSPVGGSEQAEIERYKHKILFLGMCSMEDFPLPSPNPFSANFPADMYVGMFPGWLHMFRHPESIFPSNVKLLLQSQSDFALPVLGQRFEKKYDFVFSGTDQNVADDCVGWASFAKNWSFVKQALEVMCKEYGMTGVLVATKDKQGKKACTIPKSCVGKVVQTSFLPQEQFFNYVRQSRFAFLPQVHDASPRAATHALALNTPVLMNWHIMGGWKYVNQKTGEFFHDMSDFRTSLQKLMSNLESYEPRKYMLENFGNEIQGARLKAFVEEHFADIVRLPEGTRLLIPSGA